MQSKIIGVLLLCGVLLGACAPVRLSAPVGEQRRLRFVATLTTETLEVPLHGMLRMEPDGRSGDLSGWRAERVGLALSHGPAVGVCRWDRQELVCEPSDVPGARRLLEAVAVTVGEVARMRGVRVDSPALAEGMVQVITRDGAGASEVRRVPREGVTVTVRVTGDER